MPVEICGGDDGHLYEQISFENGTWRWSVDLLSVEALKIDCRPLRSSMDWQQSRER